MSVRAGIGINLRDSIADYEFCENELKSVY